MALTIDATTIFGRLRAPTPIPLLIAALRGRRLERTSIGVSDPIEDNPAQDRRIAVCSGLRCQIPVKHTRQARTNHLAIEATRNENEK